MTVTHRAVTWPPYRPNGLLTLADWEALPADTSHRAELVEGVVLVMNRPVPRHQHLTRPARGWRSSPSTRRSGSRTP
jgi:hypothetical protein